jgi:hypothetical protein
MGDRRGLDDMVQVRRDQGACRALPADPRLLHFPIDAFELIHFVARPRDRRATFCRVAAW